MGNKIQYIGHATIIIETGTEEIIIDPYLRGEGREGTSRYNPKAALSVEEVAPALILLNLGLLHRLLMISYSPFVL